MLSILLASALALIIGFVFLLFGYRLFLVLLPVIGFFAGMWIGLSIMSAIFDSGFLATTSGLAIGFIIGLILAILSYLFYFVGVLIIAGIIGYTIGSGLMLSIGFDPGLIPATIGLVTALLIIAVTLLFSLQKYVIIILTAIIGADAILLGSLLLLGRVTLESVQSEGNAISPVLQDSWFWAIAWLVIAAAGIVFQLRYHSEYTFENSSYVEDWG